MGLCLYMYHCNAEYRKKLQRLLATFKKKFVQAKWNELAPKYYVSIKLKRENIELKN